MTDREFIVVNLINLNVFLQQINKNQPNEANIKLIKKNLCLDLKDTSIQLIVKFANFIENRAFNSYKNQAKERKNHYWEFGQQKLFCLLLPYFCFLHGLFFEMLNEQTLIALERILVSKKSFELYFQIKYLYSLSNNFRISWNEQDQKRLADIILHHKQKQNEKNIEWKNIAVELFIKNRGTHFYSPKDCREMWSNHLDPQISKEAWEIRDDCELFSYIKQYGCKWALISKKIKKNRTEHMVKNRANSIAKKYRFKSKRLTEHQANKIMQDLTKQLFEKLAQQDRIKELAQNKNAQKCKNKTNNNQSTICIQQMNSFIGQTKERLVISSNECEQNWQYGQGESFNYFQFYNNLSNNDGLLQFQSFQI